MVLQTQTHKRILIFAIFFRFFENFCYFLSFLALGVTKPHLGFDKGLDDRFLAFFDKSCKIFMFFDIFIVILQVV